MHQLAEFRVHQLAEFRVPQLAEFRVHQLAEFRVHQLAELRAADCTNGRIKGGVSTVQCPFEDLGCSLTHSSRYGKYMSL